MEEHLEEVFRYAIIVRVANVDLSFSLFLMTPPLGEPLLERGSE
jgi:hypothetical protein